MAKSKKAIYGVAFVLVLVLAAYFFLLPMIRKKAEFNARVAKLKEGIAAEQEAYRKLLGERRMLEEERPEYLEKYARDNFGWVREGEIVYKLKKEE